MTAQSRPGPISVAEDSGSGWCHWHRGPSGASVLIEIVEQGSGPGAALYACDRCREQRGLVLYDEQP